MVAVVCVCVCAADPWAHGFCGGCCVSVCAADPWAQDGSVVVVCVQLTQGPTLVLWWLLCVCVGVRLTHGPTLVLWWLLCVCAADPWAYWFRGG